MTITNMTVPDMTITNMTVPNMIITNMTVPNMTITNMTSNFYFYLRTLHFFTTLAP